MTLTEEHVQLASRIDQYVREIVRRGGDETEMLEGMYDYMDNFKQILDGCTSAEIDQLCLQFDGFYRFAKLLEDLAGGIVDGSIQVPE